MTATDPLVVILYDMGAHGLSAEVYSLSAAIDLGADVEQGDSPWPVTDARYIDGDRFGEPVRDFDKLVAEAVREREEDAAERVMLQRDYYAGLGVLTGRPR